MLLPTITWSQTSSYVMWTCLYGLVSDGLGFFHIPTDGITPAVMLERESTMTLIIVTQGVVPQELLKSELTRILPMEWEWEIQEHGDKAYVIPFPCKIELDRMVAIGMVTTKRNEGALLFEKSNSEIKPLGKLQQVCVRVFGVPLEIRSFLLLWAVGTILGATQKVAINYLTRTGVVRLLVVLLDADAVSKSYSLYPQMFIVFDFYINFDHLSYAKKIKVMKKT
jgi:hypothetical protein